MLQLIGMGLSLLGGIGGAMASNAAGQAQQAIYNEQAGQELENAKRQAGLIRKMGRAQIGATKNATVKAGLDVNSTASQDMVDYVDSTAEQDAMMTLLTGERRARSLRNQGSIAAAEGRNGAMQSVLGGIGGALPGLASLFG